MKLPNREERTEPEKQGWLMWDSAAGPYRRSVPRLSKQQRREIRAMLKKGVQNLQTINA